MNSKAPESLEALIDRFGVLWPMAKEMSPGLHQKLLSWYAWHRAIYFGDRRYFVNAICGFHEYPNYRGQEGVNWSTPHAEMLDLLTENTLKSDGRCYKLLLTPRGSYKTNLTKCEELWNLCADPETTRLLWTGEKVGNVTTDAVKWLKDQFESNERLRVMLQGDPRYESLRGDWVLTGRWNDSAFKIKPAVEMDGNSVILGSIHQSTQGQHPTRIVMDDVVTLENMTISDMEKAWIYYNEVSGNQLAAGGTITIPGTRHHKHDVYGKVMELRDLDGSLQFNTLVLDAYADEEGTKTVFSHLNFQTLELRRRSMPAWQFASQMRNKIISESLGLWSEEDFKQITVSKEIIDGCSKYILTDWAESKGERNDRTVFAVVGLHWNENAYILEVQGGRWESEETAARIYEACEKWKPRFITVEQVTGYERVITILNQFGDIAGHRLSIVPIPGRSATTKNERIEASHFRYAVGKIFFSDAIDPKYMTRKKADGVDFWAGEMVDELLEWNPVSSLHDDYADMLSDLDLNLRGRGRLCSFPRKPREEKSLLESWEGPCPFPGGSDEEGAFFAKKREKKEGKGKYAHKLDEMFDIRLN